MLTIKFISSCENDKNLPVIIWWTNLLYPHEGTKSVIKCNSGKCISSMKKHNVNDSNIYAYMFYGTDFDSSDLPLPRKQNHLWTLLHEESPMNNYIFSHITGIKLFNYTSTFSRYSDYPLTTQFIPSFEYFTERKGMSVDQKNKFRYQGIAPVMYLQSHCNVASDRDRYVKNLMNFIKIDSYGACLHNKNL
ncbi:Alpha-(1,3)-fucosyltransferase 11, partial [Stegodyphus mimosarum]